MTSETFVDKLARHSTFLYEVNSSMPVDLRSGEINELRDLMKNESFQKLQVKFPPNQDIFFFKKYTIGANSMDESTEALGLYEDGRPTSIYLLSPQGLGAVRVIDYFYELQRDYVYPISSSLHTVHRTTIKSWECTPRGRRTEKAGITVMHGLYGSVPAQGSVRSSKTLSMSFYLEHPGGLKGRDGCEYGEVARIFPFKDEKFVVYRSEMLDGSDKLILSEMHLNLGEGVASLFPKEIGSPDIVYF